MIDIILIFLFVIFIIVATIGALIYSLICFGYGGTTTDKIIGLIIGYLFGPFYWIYYFWHPQYCKPINNNNYNNNNYNNNNYNNNNYNNNNYNNSN